MTYIDDFVKGGYWPLQHFERDYDLDLRYVRYACRVDTRDEDGFYTVQDRTAGDVLGAVLWPVSGASQTEAIPPSGGSAIGDFVSVGTSFVLDAFKSGLRAGSEALAAQKAQALSQSIGFHPWAPVSKDFMLKAANDLFPGGMSDADPKESTSAMAQRDVPGWAFGWPVVVVPAGIATADTTDTRLDIKAAAKDAARTTDSYMAWPLADGDGTADVRFTGQSIETSRSKSRLPSGWTGIVHAATDEHEQKLTFHPDFLGLSTEQLLPGGGANYTDPGLSTKVYGWTSRQGQGSFGLSESLDDLPAAPLHTLMQALRMSTDAGLETDSILCLVEPLMYTGNTLTSSFSGDQMSASHNLLSHAGTAFRLSDVLTGGAGDSDTHHVEKTQDGVLINRAHIKTDAPFWMDQGHDGPLAFERVTETELLEGSTRFRVRLRWDPTGNFGAEGADYDALLDEFYSEGGSAEGTVQDTPGGHWHWSVGLPIFVQEDEDDPPPKKKKKKGKPKPPPGSGPLPPELLDPEAEPGITDFPHPSEFGQPQIPLAILTGAGADGVAFDPDPARQHKHHQHATVGSPHEWHVPGVAFRPTPVAGGDRHALDTRYNYSLTPGQVREYTERPVTARIEAFGHENGTGHWDEGCRNYAEARYLDAGGVKGGIVITPPEIGIEHIAGVLDDSEMCKSETYLVALAGDTAAYSDVWFATGTPDVLTGGVNTGFRWGGYSDGVLAFESLSSTGTGSELLRMTGGSLDLASGKSFSVGSDSWIEGAITAGADHNLLMRAGQPTSTSATGKIMRLQGGPGGSSSGIGGPLYLAGGAGSGGSAAGDVHIGTTSDTDFFAAMNPATSSATWQQTHDFTGARLELPVGADASKPGTFGGGECYVSNDKNNLYAADGSGNSQIAPLIPLSELSAGDVCYWDASAGEWAILAIGSTGETLTVSAGGIPEWA
jgi:hypothetical protein